MDRRLGRLICYVCIGKCNRFGACCVHHNIADGSFASRLGIAPLLRYHICRTVQRISGHIWCRLCNSKRFAAAVGRDVICNGLGSCIVPIAIRDEVIQHNILTGITVIHRHRNRVTVNRCQTGYGFADNQFCLIICSRLYLSAEPDVIQKIADCSEVRCVLSLVIVRFHRDKEETSQILTIRDLIGAFVGLPVIFNSISTVSNLFNKIVLFFQLIQNFTNLRCRIRAFRRFAQLLGHRICLTRRHNDQGHRILSIPRFFIQISGQVIKAPVQG